MFCTKCGKDNSEEDKFCTKCGNKLTDGKSDKKPEQTNEKPDQEKTTKKGSTGLIVALVVIFVVLGGLGTVAYFGYKYFKNAFEESFKETQDSEDIASSKLVEKTFITTTYEDGQPKDIGLGSFSAEAPYLLVVAELSRPGSPTDEFRVKWFYIPFSETTPFYTEALTDWRDRDWIASSLDLNSISEDLIPYQTLSTTFPTGKYKTEWYNGTEYLDETEFIVSGQ